MYYSLIKMSKTTDSGVYYSLVETSKLLALVFTLQALREIVIRSPLILSKCLKLLTLVCTTVLSKRLKLLALVWTLQAVREIVIRSPLTAPAFPPSPPTLASYLLTALERRSADPAIVDGLSGAVTSRQQLKGTNWLIFELKNSFFSSLFKEK